MKPVHTDVFYLDCKRAIVTNNDNPSMFPINSSFVNAIHVSATNTQPILNHRSREHSRLDFSEQQRWK